MIFNYRGYNSYKYQYKIPKKVDTTEKLDILILCHTNW